VNYQLKGTGASIIVHAIILALFVYASAIQPVKKKVISLDFSIVEHVQPTASKGEKKVAEARKVKAVKPKPIEKKKIVNKVEDKPVIQKKKEVAVPAPEPLPEKLIAKEIEEPEPVEETTEKEAIEAASDPDTVEEEILSATDNLDSNSIADNSAAASQAIYVKNHFMYIKEKIQKKIVYPRIARRRGLQGKAVVSFIVCKDGSITDVKIVESSGYKILDNSAIKTVKSAAPFPPPPVRAELIIPMVFKLS